MNYRSTIWRRAAWCAALGTIAALTEGARGQAFETTVRPVLEEHCLGCHDGVDNDSGFDLARFRTEADALAAPDAWERVWTRVIRFEMPPGGGKFGDQSRAKLMGWIDAHRQPDKDCATLASDDTQQWYGGVVMSRRLTRAEYNNSIRDLVGLDLRPADAFPADGSGGEGFDNVGSTLFLSATQLEMYLQAAHQALQAALGDPAARRRVITAAPDRSRSPREAAAAVVADFAGRAYRRPATDDEVNRLVALYDAARARGDDHLASLQLPLEAVLISPNFLFLPEPEPAATGVYRLDHHQLATRLAYFLWASTPDEPLRALADAGRLHDEASLRAEVRRMLADPRADGFAENFAMQWLGLGALGTTVRPDPVRYPGCDDALLADMRREAAALVARILRENRSVLELLDSDYAMLNARLAAHYGVGGVEGDELRPVALEDGRRGGVLGLGAVLTATSYPLRTSPVLRGKWVLETVLGAAVPPPPPNAGKLPDDDHATDRDLTFRQRLELHRTQPECAACHARMDPLGFGLENFDAVGRWRHHQNGAPVDASGQLPSGEEFVGPAELKHVLLARQDEFIRNLSRKMLAYALGRGLNRFDDCVVRDAQAALAANDHRAAALVESIVLSYPFQHRYARK